MYVVVSYRLFERSAVEAIVRAFPFVVIEEEHTGTCVLRLDEDDLADHGITDFSNALAILNELRRRAVEVRSDREYVN